MCCPPLSPTNIRLWQTCPTAYRRRYVDRLLDWSNPAADTGKAFHRWAAGESLVSVLASLPDEVAADVLDILARYQESGGIPLPPADATDISTEMEIAITAQGEVVAWEETSAVWRGRVDQVWREGTLAVVRDWKTSRVIEEPGSQMRQYGWAVSTMWPEVERVAVELRFVRYGQTARRQVFDADELRERVPLELFEVRRQIEEMLQADRWPTKIGEHCRVCGYWSSCPAMQRLAGSQPVTRVEDERSAMNAARQLIEARRRAKEIEDSLRVWCIHHGSIKVGDRELGHHPAVRRELGNISRVSRLLMGHGLSLDRIWQELRLPLTGLDRLTRSAVDSLARRERKAARERIEHDLMEAGLLAEQLGTKFGFTETPEEGDCVPP